MSISIKFKIYLVSEIFRQKFSSISDTQVFLVSLSRGKELSAKDEIISELKAQLSERQKEIDKIENDWSNAKHRLSKDSTIRRLVSENDQLKRMFERSYFYTLCTYYHNTEI